MIIFSSAKFLIPSVLNQHIRIFRKLYHMIYISLPTSIMKERLLFAVAQVNS